MEEKVVPGQIARSGGHWVAYFRTGAVLVDMVGKRVDAKQAQLTQLVTLDQYTKTSA